MAFGGQASADSASSTADKSPREPLRPATADQPPFPALAPREATCYPWDTVDPEIAGKVKVVGRLGTPHGGVAEAAPFFDLVIQLRGNKPFLPRGVHRFSSFKESHEWSLKMMARPANPARRA